MATRLPGRDDDLRVTEEHLREQLKTLTDMQRELVEEHAALDFAREVTRKLRAQARSLIEENALLRTKLATAVMRARRLEMQLNRKKGKP